MHCSQERALGTIRFSTGRPTAFEEVDRAVAVVSSAVKKQREQKNVVLKGILSLLRESPCLSNSSAFLWYNSPESDTSCLQCNGNACFSICTAVMKCVFREDQWQLMNIFSMWSARLICRRPECGQSGDQGDRATLRFQGQQEQYRA